MIDAPLPSPPIAGIIRSCRASGGGFVVCLYLILEERYDFTRATEAMRWVVQSPGRFVWLNPASMAGTITILDMQVASSPEQRAVVAQRWARSVWGAWAPHHATIRYWAGTAEQRHP